MRANNQKRLSTIAASEPAGGDWKTAAVRRLLPAILHDPNYAKVARKPHIVGTPPGDVKRFESEANAYLIKLCRRLGEDRYADWLLTEATSDQ